ncbi:Exopolyphosphatase [Cladophialophora chaetospira]|uniref:Exopolyphosphatase n=1 Tax=Cladophialophora chaetospira TaxID=386627 RepID=A0AA39CR80_9EURO|nr:Exopolyphosphatase [Cladophialophora chaetospira]
MSQRTQAVANSEEEPNMPSLRSYLSRMKNLALSSNANSSQRKTALVMGNPSADLDSFISAVVTSYLYNLRRNARQSGSRTYIPVLNLPAIRSSDLWRLRPEYGVAVRLALGEPADAVSQGEAGSQGKTSVLDELVTIADLKENEESSLQRFFLDSGDSESRSEEGKQHLFLVDHNSPSIPGLSAEVISSRFTVTGCIDHHVDENYISKDAKPRIITTGIGSCTSLVVKHLRDQGMWPSPVQEETQPLVEISRLALAPILIDTSNLKARGDKCSDIDREVVKFLESIIKSQSAEVTKSSTSSPSAWDGGAFHASISTAKSNSLDLLSMPEIFDRDYKVWTEKTSSGSEINIGISSLVRPLSWLIKHAGGIDEFLASISDFANDLERKLGVFCLLTRTGEGRKEVVVLSFDEAVKDLTAKFEDRGTELQLKRWAEDRALMDRLTQKFEEKGERTGEWKIWFMGDTSKSRKQVGPLLREVVRDL